MPSVHDYQAEKDQIWVIGGYGQVGSMVCTVLARSFPGKVWAAGTRLEKAIEFSRSTGGAIQPLLLDVRKESIPPN